MIFVCVCVLNDILFKNSTADDGSIALMGADHTRTSIYHELLKYWNIYCREAELCFLRIMWLHTLGSRYSNTMQPETLWGEILLGLALISHTKLCTYAYFKMICTSLSENSFSQSNTNMWSMSTLFFICKKLGHKETKIIPKKCLHPEQLTVWPRSSSPGCTSLYCWCQVHRISQMPGHRRQEIFFSLMI